MPNTPLSNGCGLLLAAALLLAPPATARQAPGISIETLPARDGGATLVVTGPASAHGLLVVGTAPLAAPRLLTTQGGLVLRVGVQARAVLPFTTGVSGRWQMHMDALPDGLLLQALFPGPGRSSPGFSVGSSPAGAGFSSVTPVISCPQPVKPGDLVITEVQRDPAAVPDSDGEWFELSNRTGCDIDVEGWAVLDETGQGFVISTGLGVIVPAQGTLVLGRSLDPVQNGGVPVDYEYSNFLFDELADRIVLLDAAGVEMERVEWDPSWPANEAGRALSLEPGQGAVGNDLPGNWCLSSTPIDPLSFLDFGTPGATNPSCACAGQPDLPDAGFVDSNCDGIDGDRARAVFVAKSGSPTGLGTLSDPVDSVSAALAIAAANPALDHVYVSQGIYAELVQLVDGISIWGGFDAAAGWSRSSANKTKLTHSNVSGGTQEIVSLLGVALTQPIVIGDVELRASSVSAPLGTSVFAARLHQVADLRLERVRLIADAGAAASHGSPGPGYASGSYAGGQGGKGGSPSSSGYDGYSGTGPAPGAGGSGGYYSAGDPGGLGAPGSGAPNGMRATSALPELVGGQWSVPDGSGGNGGPGYPGSGGGGGGGGAGGFLTGSGGNGGTGGYGGRGGNGGQGAGPGGSSVALVASSSQVELVDCVLEAADGGNGGNGGPGYQGENGLNGGSGAVGSGGYQGGSGGNGGKGGSGGAGGAGAGGSSFGIVAGQLANVTLTGSTTVTHGVGGLGGASPPPAAVAGLSGAVITVPE